MVTFPRPIYKRIPRLNDHKQSQNYTTLDVRQTYHIGDDGARRSILQFYPPSCISLLTSQNVLENLKNLKKRRNRDKSVPVNNKKKQLLDGDLLLLYCTATPNAHHEW